MTPTLSIIVPIYKVEDYLERCVYSVLNQNYKDFELFLVDDGSPDRCPQMCEELAHKDCRIRVIHKVNGGLSSARNAGLEEATGKYICFLDSDDQWIDGRLSLIMEQIEYEPVDMLVFNAVSLYPNGDIRKRNNGDFFDKAYRVMSKRDYYESVIAHGDLLEAAYTKIFPRSFLIDNHLFFQTGITAEDTEWMFRILRIASKIAVSNVVLYKYTCQRPGSITSTVSTRGMDNLMIIMNQSIQFCSQNHHSCADLELEHCSYLLSCAIGYLIDQKGAKKQEYKNKLRNYCSLFEYSKHPRTRKAKLFYRIMGYDLMVHAMTLYMWLKRKNIVNRKYKVNGDKN